MAAVSWSTATSGTWGEGANWDTTAQPASTDDAFLAVGSTATPYTVTLAADPSADPLGSLTISSGGASLVYIGNRTFNITNDISLSAGAFTTSGAGSTTTAGSLHASGGTFIHNDGVFTVTGLAEFTGGANSAGMGNDGIFNAGTFVVGASTSFNIFSGSLISGAGGVQVADDATINMNDGGFLNATVGGLVIEGDQGIVAGNGTISGDVSGTGFVIASEGVLALTSNIESVTVQFHINDEAGSVLQFDGALEEGNTITFDGAVGELLYNNVGVLAANIVGLNVGSTIAAPTNFIDFNLAPGLTLDGDNKGSGTGGTFTLSDGSTLVLTGVVDATPDTWYVNTKADTDGSTLFYLSEQPCFAAGTRILTTDGEKLVDAIVPGDSVITLVDGAYVAQPVKWVGERKLNIAAHPRPELAAPVRISRGAFGENLPQRDLFVSPDHCMFVDGKLIPAKLLINGMTIVQLRDVPSVHYYHVETEKHSVLLAEGLPAESYLDTGNRAYFSNSNLALVLHPEFHVNAGLKTWEKDACAPFAITAEAVEPVWRTLAERAESLGYVREDVATTDDADLRLLANGRDVRPVSVSGGCHVFVLPAGTDDIRLASRTAIPSDSTAWLDDWRRLGVAVKRIVVRDADGATELPVDHPALGDGWYPTERDTATQWRWTDGNARLPIATVNVPVTVEVHVGMTVKYPTVERLAA